MRWGTHVGEGEHVQRLSTLHVPCFSNKGLLSQSKPILVARLPLPQVHEMIFFKGRSEPFIWEIRECKKKEQWLEVEYRSGLSLNTWSNQVLERAWHFIGLKSAQDYDIVGQLYHFNSLPPTFHVWAHESVKRSQTINKYSSTSCCCYVHIISHFSWRLWYLSQCCVLWRKTNKHVSFIIYKFFLLEIYHTLDPSRWSRLVCQTFENLCWRELQILQMLSLSRFLNCNYNAFLKLKIFEDKRWHFITLNFWNSIIK